MHLNGHDHEGREKLFRYILRPPLALRRLSMGEDGRLLYRMKRRRAGGLVLSLTPDELLARLATLVPPPRSHGLRYHGVFAPNSKLRSRVVPPPPSLEAEPAHCRPRTGPPKSPPVGGEATSTTGERKPKAERRYRVPWAELLRKV